MESEVIDKIRVLFDADKVREEKVNQVIEKNQTVQKQTLDIWWPELPVYKKGQVNHSYTLKPASYKVFFFLY